MFYAFETVGDIMCQT